MQWLKKILGAKGIWAMIMLAILLLMRILFPSAIIEDDYWHGKFLRGFDLAGVISLLVGAEMIGKGIADKEAKQTVKGAVFVILGAILLYYVVL